MEFLRCFWYTGEVVLYFGYTWNSHFIFGYTGSLYIYVTQGLRALFGSYAIFGIQGVCTLFCYTEFVRFFGTQGVRVPFIFWGYTGSSYIFGTEEVRTLPGTQAVRTVKDFHISIIYRNIDAVSWCTEELFFFLSETEMLSAFFDISVKIMLIFFSFFSSVIVI